MLTVYKYELPIADIAKVALPEGAEILSVGLQGGLPMLWARVDTEVTGTEVRMVRLAGTGHPHADGRFIGSMMSPDGALVIHAFDLGPVVLEALS